MLCSSCWLDFSLANKAVVLVVGIVLRVPPFRLQSRTKIKAKEWFAKRKFRTRNKSEKEKDFKFTK